MSLMGSVLSFMRLGNEPHELGIELHGASWDKVFVLIVEITVNRNNIVAH